MSVRANEGVHLKLDAAAEQTLRDACARSTPQPAKRTKAPKPAADDTIGERRGDAGQDASCIRQREEREMHARERALRDFSLLTTTLGRFGFVALLDANARIVCVSASCKDTLCGEEEVETSAFWNVFCGVEQRASLRRACEMLRKSGAGFEWEGSCPSHDAQDLLIRWKLTPLASIAASSYVIAVGDDLTERERLRSQLFANDRLVAMGTLAAGMGHEINNPLAYLMMSIELATRSAERLGALVGGPEARRLPELLATASEGAERIRVIVDELRSMARPAQRSVQDVDVRSVLESCVQIAGHEIRHRATLVREYGQVPMVHADRNRLGQVFLNLIINAAQSIPDGHATDNTIRLVVREHASQVLVEVHDSGGGIDPLHRARLFDPFFTTKPMGEGLGLGLSVSQRIVTEMDGTIDVVSERNKGSMFRVSLPSANPVEPGPASTTALQQSSACRRRLRILIVDDEIKVAQMLASLLEGHEVHTERDGRAALRLCACNDYDVILCDLQMPELSGQDLHRELARQRPGYEHRIVFMTGGAFTKRAREFIAHVPNRVVGKPFTVDDVLAFTSSTATLTP